MFQKIGILIQALVLVGISATFLFSEKKQISESEKRTLAQWPTLNDSTYFSGSVGMRDSTFLFYFVDLASNFFIKIYFIIFIVILIFPVFFAKN